MTQARALQSLLRAVKPLAASMSINEVADLFLAAEHRAFLSLPVVDENGHMLGIVSIGDAVSARLKELAAEKEALRQQHELAKAELRREKAEKEAARLEAERLAQEAVDAEKRAARKERKQLTKEEQKAARDARYAARKARLKR